MSTINLHKIAKAYGRQQVLNGIDLEIASGELVTLLGPSGCGKTTLLRILAGLDHADGGQVLVDGQDATELKLRDRQVGFVFQHYALFRHMSITDNVAFGLKMRPRRLRPSAQQIKKRVDELLSLVQLDAFSSRFPHQLSGGQRQRAALARALAIDPKILLLDEPFGALDAQVRKDLRVWLRDLQQRLGITTVLVTHDQEEAIDIADRVVLMNQGSIEQEGPPEALYRHPKSAFAVQFLGGAKQLDQELTQAAKNATNRSDQDDDMHFLRAHEVKIQLPTSSSHGQKAYIKRISWRGAWIRLQLETHGSTHRSLVAELGREYWESLGLELGDLVEWYPERVHQFSQPLQKGII